jgi:hypothetical protein
MSILLSECRIMPLPKKRVIPQDLSKQAEFVGIKFPTAQPLFSSPPSEAAKRKFVEAHNSEHFSQYKELAQVFVDHINYISYEQFLTTFTNQVNLFTKNLGNEPYVLWISQNYNPQFNNNNKIKEEGFSELWLAGLAFEYSDLPKPASIETSDTLKAYLEKNPHIKKVLVLDDGIYSGNHLRREIRDTEISNLGADLSIVIGYGTKHGTESISDLARCYFSSMNFYIGEIIPTFAECLSPELKKFAELIHVTYLNNTLTYYDHVMPDFMSTNPLLDSASKTASSTLGAILQHMLMKGYYIEDEQNSAWLNQLASHAGLDISELAKGIKGSDEWNALYNTIVQKINLIPIIHRPYRLHNLEKFKAFQKHYEEGLLGVKNSLLPPERLEALFALFAPAFLADFDLQLEIINKKIIDMEKIVSYDPNSNYKKALEAANLLLVQLKQIKLNFIESEHPDKAVFKRDCQKAIKLARVELEVHRGWKQFFADILSVLCSIITLGSINLISGRSLFGLFPTPTDSATKLDQFETTMSLV